MSRPDPFGVICAAHRGERRQLVGAWFAHKYRSRVRSTGDIQAVARAMRRQGVPLAIALRILGISSSMPHLIPPTRTRGIPR